MSAGYDDDLIPGIPGMPEGRKAGPGQYYRDEIARLQAGWDRAADKVLEQGEEIARLTRERDDARDRVKGCEEYSQTQAESILSLRARVEELERERDVAKAWVNDFRAIAGVSTEISRSLGETGEKIAQENRALREIIRRGWQLAWNPRLPDGPFAVLNGANEIARGDTKDEAIDAAIREVADETDSNRGGDPEGRPDG